MSLTPFFSLSAVSPKVNTYDPASSGEPYASAWMSVYGLHAKSWSDTLAEQVAGDRLLLAYDPVEHTNDQVTYNNDVMERCSVLTTFAGHNVSTSNQYLLVYRLKRALGAPIVQFFSGLTLLSSVELKSSSTEDAAILIDVPGDGYSMYTGLRLAADSPHSYHGFYFMGVDCYLL